MTKMRVGRGPSFPSEAATAPANPVPRVTRAERADQVLSLHAEGLNPREIAERIGLAPSSVRSILSDPDGSRQQERRRSYQGACVDCGAATDGSNGLASAPVRCHPCYSKTRTRWTRERLVEAIQDFAARYGRPPSAPDWNPSHTRRMGQTERAERFYVDGCWPHLATVQSVFGSWSAAIRAAGFPSNPVGRPRSVTANVGRDSVDPGALRG